MTELVEQDDEENEHPPRIGFKRRPKSYHWRDITEFPPLARLIPREIVHIIPRMVVVQVPKNDVIIPKKMSIKSLERDTRLMLGYLSGIT